MKTDHYGYTHYTIGERLDNWVEYHPVLSALLGTIVFSALVIVIVSVVS